MSVAQAVPLMKQETARCQTSSRPARARRAIALDVASVTKRTTISASLRLSLSVAAPAKAPNKAMGRMRSNVSMVTMNAEPVTW